MLKLFTWVALTIGLVIYYAPNWHEAFRVTYYQGVALLTLAVNEWWWR